jgi:uncharacterized repeat protein (TIGR03803 family)
MKVFIKRTFALPMLAAALGYGLAVQVDAQTLTTLFNFSAAFPYTISNASGLSSGWYTNSDGSGPNAVILSGNALYGTAWYGGAGANGTVFKVKTDGTGLTVLHSFMAPNGYVPDRGEVNGDGANPNGNLVLSGNTLYGTASQGGTWGGGTVFALNTDGTGFTLLHTFVTTNNLCFDCPGSDGNSPYAGLILAGNTLYGTTAFGGDSGNGTVFKINADGTGYSILYSFSDFATNNDGAYPYGGLVLSGNTLYGTTSAGGSTGGGTIFALDTDGTGFTNLHTFGFGLNVGGLNPNADLALSGSTLYGTAAGEFVDGWAWTGGGTVFELNIDGTGFSVLHRFVAQSDGDVPYSGVILSGNTLYGTAAIGGSGGNGTVFALNTDGTAFRTLHVFSALYTNASGSYTNNDGARPFNRLVMSGNTLYGVAQGGSFGSGTIFSIPFPSDQPQLTITPVGSSLILTWPTNFLGFNLETSASLGPTQNWTHYLGSILVIGDQSVVTADTSTGSQFFRLHKP